MNNVSDRPSASGGVPRAILVGLFLGPWTVLWGTWTMIAGPLGLKRLCHWGLKCWGGGIVSVSGIRVDVHGQLPPAGTPCVFFVNHQSALDIPILFRACMNTHDVRFMAKESLFKIPFLGWGMAWSGFIPIRRESARQAAEVFRERLATKNMGETPMPQGNMGETPMPRKNAASYSYIIFPEGTRSPDGRLQPFKRGAIGLALRLSLPVVPVTLVDACRANPKGSLLVRPGTVRVTFHEPIVVDANAGREQRDELLARVYAAILSALPEDQRPAP